MASESKKPVPDTKNLAGAKENVFCMHVAKSTSLDYVQKSLIDVSDGDLQISNTYFSARASVKLLTNANDDNMREVLQCCSAVMLVTSSVTDLENSKNAWISFSKSVSADCVRLFVADFSCDEAQMDELRAWGVAHGIEIVSAAICAEDGITVDERTRSALDCAAWPQKTALEIESVITSVAVRNQLRTENELRRGLDEDDVEKITQVLLTLEDEGSDSES